MEKEDTVQPDFTYTDTQKQQVETSQINIRKEISIIPKISIKPQLKIVKPVLNLKD